MKYCKKCGAEIPDGAGFCEKCGNPVGQAPKQKGGKKKWVFAIGSGIIILAVVVAGGLFATGIIGDKDVVQTSTDTADIQETPSVTGEAVVGGETLEGDKQKDTSDNGNTEDMAWEAFQAYKILINDKKYEWEEEVAEIWGEDASNASTYYYFELIYLDGDDYPELLIHQSVVRPTGGVIYTYKGGETEEISSFAGGTISYQEKMGYIYSRGWYTCDWTECMNFYDGDSSSSLFNNTISDSNYEYNYYGVGKVAKLAGINNQEEWTTLDFSDSENGSDIVWGENIDEAYTQLLSRNKEKENN